MATLQNQKHGSSGPGETLTLRWGSHSPLEKSLTVENRTQSMIWNGALYLSLSYHGHLGDGATLAAGLASRPQVQNRAPVKPWNVPGMSRTFVA